LRCSVSKREYKQFETGHFHPTLKLAISCYFLIVYAQAEFRLWHDHVFTFISSLSFFKPALFFLVVLTGMVSPTKTQEFVFQESKSSHVPPPPSVNSTVSAIEIADYNK